MTIAEELIQKGRQQGEAEGRAQGRAEGKAEGRLQGQIVMMRRVLSLPQASFEQFEELDLPGLSATVRDLETEAQKRGIL